MNLISKKYIIFDCDGTLLDSLDCYKIKFCENLKKIGVPKRVSEKIYWFFLKFEKLDQFSLIGRILKSVLWKLTEGEIKETPFEGVEELLRKICFAGARIFVSSGALYPEKRLRRVGLDRYFEIMLGAEEFKKGREHIQIFAGFLNENFADFCRQAIWIGDSPDDMAIAKTYKIYGVGIANRHNEETLRRCGAQQVVPHIKELL